MNTPTPDVLLVSPDPELVRILSGLLEEEPCVLTPFASPVEVRAGQGRGSAAALILDRRADYEAVSLVAALRGSGRLSPASPVVFLTDRVEDWPQIAEMGAWLATKPASLLDLVDQLRRAILRPPAPTAPSVSPISNSDAGAQRATARRLARWWSNRATGVLCLDGWTDGWAVLSHGGPVGEYAMTALQTALAGGEISLEPCEADDEHGDTMAMATLLWSTARNAVAGESVLSLVPVRNGLTTSCMGMPMNASTRRCLGRLGDASVERLAAREGAPVAEVAADLAALRWLGLIGLRNAQTARVEVDIDSPTCPSAHRVLLNPKAAERAAPGLPLDRLVVDGIAAVSVGEWAQADELLTRAHHLSPQNPAVAAHLGWARLHNPALPEDSRGPEGADLIERALEIDPACALAWRYYAELAARRGDLPESARCLKLAEGARS